MKLYATVESERAKKAQGGNRHLKMYLNVGSATDSNHVATILLNVVENDVVLQVWDKEKGELCERQIYSLEGQNITKGKKKKDEYCEQCMSTPCQQE